MILFLQHKGSGRRGGEITTDKIHEYFKSRYSNVEPDELVELNENTKHPIKHIFSSYRKVKDYNPALVVVDVSSGIRNIFACLWQKKHGGKLMVVMLGLRMHFRYSGFWAIMILKSIVRFAEKLLLGISDVILVNSQYTAKYVNKYAKRNTPVIIAHPGLDLKTEKTNVQNELTNQVNLLFVGECIKVKGLYYLVKSLSLLKSFNIHLDIIGSYDQSNSYYKKIISNINKNKIADKATFHGFLSHRELENYYSRASIFVMPSLFEGYGKSLAEAFSFGLPIVATRVGAIPEFAEAGVNAILVSPRSAIELAEAIEKLITDSELRKKMKIVNSKKAKSFPSWDDFHATLDMKLKPIIDQLIIGNEA
jgi:glycosyltransferase involved in cell wall biosynthesis